MTGINATGTVTIYTNECGTLSANVSGSISGNVLQLNATYFCGGQSIPTTFVLPASMGNTETGPYAIYFENGSTYDYGTWQLTRQTPATVTITATAGAGTTITPSGTTTVDYRANQTYAISALPGYTLSSVLVNGVSIGTPSSYTFQNVTSNSTLAASATLDPIPPETPVLTPILNLLMN